MGRQQYLTRLALGRSAFEDIEQSPPLERGLNDQNAPGEADSSAASANTEAYVQQYDSRGRPHNPATERFNSELRAAQNEVLALVGVVERKDRAAEINALRNVHGRRGRKEMLADENEWGDVMEFVLVPVKFFLRYWVDAFVQRIQIGRYDPQLSFATILSMELRSLRTGNLGLALASLFPGIGDHFGHLLVRFPLITVVEQITGRLQNLVQRRRLSRKAARYAYWTISLLFEAMLFGIDIALLPLEYYSGAQRSGLAPAMPIFPPLQTFLIRSANSFHHFGWKHLVPIFGLRVFTSPAALLLAQRIFCFDTDEEDVPVFSLLTPFRYPAINDSIKTIQAPKISQDPIGWISYQSWRLRFHFMQYCNWNLVKRNPRAREDDYENNTYAFHIDRTEYPIWRSTNLSHIVPKAFSETVKDLIHRFLTLPFDSLVLRSVAVTYMAASNTLKTPAALASAPYLYAPFGGSPISQFLRSPGSSSARDAVGTYLSRLGLAFALHTSIDTILFFGLYGLTRHFGITEFRWKTIDPSTRDRAARLGWRHRHR